MTGNLHEPVQHLKTYHRLTEGASRMSQLRVRQARALEGFQLELILTDDSVIIRDVSDLLAGPVFAPLVADPAQFASILVDTGTVSWQTGADICPDVLIWGGQPPIEASASPPRFLKLAPQSLESKAA